MFNGTALTLVQLGGCALIVAGFAAQVYADFRTKQRKRQQLQQQLLLQQPQRRQQQQQQHRRRQQQQQQQEQVRRPRVRFLWLLCSRLHACVRPCL